MYGLWFIDNSALKNNLFVLKLDFSFHFRAVQLELGVNEQAAC